MKNYTITKDQIVELSGYGITHILKRMIPDAFKKEFTTGKWYKIDKNIFCCTEIDEDGSLYGYGLFDGLWNKMLKNGRSNCACNSVAANDRLVESTLEEVEAALIEEAKKRGFIDGAKFKSFEHGNPIRTVRESGRLNFNMITNHLLISTPESEWDNYQSNPAIFEKGKWAQIIPQEKQVIPMEKALKIIAKKLKTSPDNIEIK